MNHPTRNPRPAQLRSFIAAAFCILALMPSPHSTFAGDIDMTKLKTFGNTGKELTVLEAGREAELLSHKGRGCLTHMWFGGGFEGCSRLRIRIYVDGETTASIDMELFLGHGIGFADETAVPWGTPRIGKLGTGTSVYDTYRIPFGSSIRVTAQLPPDIHANPLFWWIVRGTENLPVQIGGVTLPDNARLHLYKVVDKVAQPLEEFPLCDVKGDGALYEVTMAAQGLRTTTVEKDRWQDLAFMEGCMRAYKDGDPEPLMLSSGLEDYFLGTYYFNKGLYHTPVAGCTHLDVAHNSFSAYRFHDDDPVFFHDGLKLTARCGEKIGDKVFHNAPPARYTTYTWLYQW